MLHDEWGYAALRMSADIDDVEARDLATATVPVLERVRAAFRAMEARYSELPDEALADPASSRTATTSSAAAPSARSASTPSPSRPSPPAVTRRAPPGGASTTTR